METAKLTLHYFFNVVVWFLFGIFIIAIALSALTGSSLLGDHHLYIVQSGSMEPSIMTGDMIVTSKSQTYQKNDVITFNSPARGVVTHRITSISHPAATTTIETKGDANRTTDSDEITLDQIIGKVVYVLPKFGYLVIFCRQPLGFAIFIGIPGLIIVVEELLKLGQKNAKK